MLLERLGIVVHRSTFNYNHGGRVAAIVERADEVRQLSAQGLGDTKIGRHFGVSADIIRKVRQKIGLGPQSPNNKWKDRKDELLAKLRDGMSRGQIADELGVSRNAIIGACHRYGLDADEIVRKKVQEQRREAANKLVRDNRQVLKGAAKAAKSRKSQKVAQSDSWRWHMRAQDHPSTETRCTLMEIGMGQCRYPVDNDCQFYCGATTETDTGSWCPYHAQFVFNRTSGDAGGISQRHPRLGVESNSPPLRSVNSTPPIHEAA